MAERLDLRERCVGVFHLLERPYADPKDAPPVLQYPEVRAHPGYTA